MAKALIIVVAHLPWSEYPGLIFDGSSSQEHMPVSAACLLGEGRGDRQDLCTVVDQAAVEFRKSQVVADAHSDFTAGAVGHDSVVPRSDGVGLFEPNPVLDIHIEEVDLSVVRESRSIGAKEKACVVAAFGFAFCDLRYGTHQKRNFKFGG